MNIKEMIDAIALKTGESRSEIQRILEAFMDITGDTLADDKELDLDGFGTFSTFIIPPRTLRDIKTKELVEMGESKGVRFKAGSELSGRVN